MTPPPLPTPALPADQRPLPVPEQVTPTLAPDETADLFRWMSWSAAVAMNA